MDSGLCECIIELLEVSREDHRKYPEAQSRTFLSFDLLIGVLLNRLSCWLFLPMYC